ncbi:MAG: hypothetical protein K6F10_02585 [Paludibacteraceae bacterium]|nr:hypothetical protein [Paludibacteraceae bacterium]
MDKGKTPLDVYQDQVGHHPRPQTKEEVEARFNELLTARDDDFLQGIVHSGGLVKNEQLNRDKESSK